MFQRILEVIQAQWYIMSAYDISKDCDRLSRFTQNGLTSRLYNRELDHGRARFLLSH